VTGLFDECQMPESRIAGRQAAMIPALRRDVLNGVDELIWVSKR
jgi:hypothetical protein